MSQYPLKDEMVKHFLNAIDGHTSSVKHWMKYPPRKDAVENIEHSYKMLGKIIEQYKKLIKDEGFADGDPITIESILGEK
jgi:hypothetical protein